MHTVVVGLTVEVEDDVVVVGVVVLVVVIEVVVVVVTVGLVVGEIKIVFSLFMSPLSISSSTY